jgi:DNA polymerase I-like protein with 3'-5' exonuclease and polymerase domains
MITLDFETNAIDGNTSAYAPEAQGLAVKIDNEPSEYLDWGHPDSQDGERKRERARMMLHNAWNGTYGDMLFHHAKFDVSVAMGSFHLPLPPDPLKVHDTMYTLFLNDPYAADLLSLKPASEAYLGWAPEEQDDLKDWILRNIKGSKASNFGAFIAKTPIDLAAPYATGDTDRTYALHQAMHPIIQRRDMGEAYKREQLIMPIAYESEHRGLRVDEERMGEDLALYEKTLLWVEDRIRIILGLNLSDLTPTVIVNGLLGSGLADEAGWPRTATGKLSTARGALTSSVNHPELLYLLQYRGALATCLQTFMRPWYDLCDNGRIHTTWNQVRSWDRKSTGARTGRFSASKPGLMNVPNEYEIQAPAELRYELIELPLMRRYLLPEEGHVWIKRDFSSQEVRIAAHYEDGELMQKYQNNPQHDPHEDARQIIFEQTGLDISRKYVKITAFRIIYGSGINGLAKSLGIPYPEAQQLRNAYFGAVPGIKALAKSTSARGRRGDVIRTWGGREYNVEPPKLINGVWRSFEYKLLNYLIQGSAADQTKQALIDWNSEKEPDTHFSAAVHDEINASAPAEDWKGPMATLRRNMNAPRFDVPFASEGFAGKNWYDIKATE